VVSRRGRRSSQIRSGRRAPRDVFINVPFDSQGERVFIALITGLVALGLNPRCVLEIDPDRPRLARLFNLISECGYSVHDLSRVSTSRAGAFRVPRFNMPFELGLAVAVALSASSAVQHRWRVIEQVPHRLATSLSDLGGYDPAIYSGTVEGLLRALTDLMDVPGAPLRGEREMMSAYRKVQRVRATLRGDIFRREAFRQLVLAARLIVEEIADKRERDLARVTSANRT
jgi:hypothetical protein